MTRVLVGGKLREEEFHLLNGFLKGGLSISGREIIKRKKKKSYQLYYPLVSDSPFLTSLPLLIDNNVYLPVSKPLMRDWSRTLASTVVFGHICFFSFETLLGLDADLRAIATS